MNQSDSPREDVPLPLVREFYVTPEFIACLSKGGRFEVTGAVLPPDAKVRLDLTYWDDVGKRLAIVVESAQFPDLAEELPSPKFRPLE